MLLLGESLGMLYILRALSVCLNSNIAKPPPRLPLGQLLRSFDNAIDEVGENDKYPLGQVSILEPLVLIWEELTNQARNSKMTSLPSSVLLFSRLQCIVKKCLMQ